MGMSADTLSGNVGESVLVTTGTSLTATEITTLGEFSKDVTTRRTAPNTLHDMDMLEKWEYGDDVHGTFAKSIEAFKNYRDDINKAYGKEDDYEPIYIDTLNTKKSVGERLTDLKK